MKKKFVLMNILLLMLSGEAVNLWAGCLIQPRIVGYLPLWAVSSYTPNWNNITHLCLAFGVVQVDGTVDVTDVRINRHIIDEAHRNDVKVLLSIGGGGTKNFSSVILDKEKRKILVDELRCVVDELGLDGVDLDYEEWEGGVGGASESDWEKRAALENLYKELRGKLNGKKLIAAAVNASWDNGGTGVYNCYSNTMFQYLDFVSLMIYDFSGPWSGTYTGPHSAWEFYVKSIRYWLENKKLPKDKLVAGVPFYGYKFLKKNCADGVQSMAYREILEEYPERNAHLSDSVGLIYYDGIYTIKRKAEYIKEQKLGGIMVWEITQDTEMPDKSLLNQINRILKRK